VAWELDRSAINGGGGRLGGAAVPGRGRAEAAVGEWGGSLMVRWRRRTGAERPGRRGRLEAREAGGRRGQGEGLEVGDAPDRWAPPVGERVREGGEVGWRCLLGRKGDGPAACCKCGLEKTRRR
jgi:hypothetical protein